MPVQVSGFGRLIVQTPSVNEPWHFKMTQQTESSLASKRRNVDRFQNTMRSNNSATDFLRMLGRTNTTT